MKAILLVLDGLGIGAMDDVTETRPKDRHANTLKHIAEAVHPLRLPTLRALGLGNILALPEISPQEIPLASYGECDLGYPGADSFMGHQAIMGTLPKEPHRVLMSEIHNEIAAALAAAGHQVTYPFPQHPILLVDGAVTVADNLEADAGQIINLTVPTRQIDFDQALEIGWIVRRTVKTSRVIVFGGPNITVTDIFNHVETRPTGQVGVNSPELGVYDEHLVVRHLGYGIDPQRQLASTYARANRPVFLAGKMADLIDCPAARRNAAVDSAQVMELIIDYAKKNVHGLMAATVQETDLAGHEKDPQRYANILKLVDEKLAALLPWISANDVLVITADHGNDPTLPGTRQHTRERTPLLWYQPSKAAAPLGRRSSLADISAALARWAGLPWQGDGDAFAP